MLDFHLEPELERRLEAIAAKTGRSTTFYVSEAVREKIEDLEDIAAATAVMDNPGRRWTMEEAERELGLED